jgi:hypothetical protein
VRAGAAGGGVSRVPSEGEDEEGGGGADGGAGSRTGCRKPGGAVVAHGTGPGKKKMMNIFFVMILNNFDIRTIVMPIFLIVDMLGHGFVKRSWGACAGSG